PEKIRIILGNWIRILWFVNILENSSGVNKRMLGRNATGGFTSIIERLHPTFRIVSERWSRFSCPLSVAAMPDYFAKRCMKFTFRGFNGGMPTLRLRFLEQQGRCSLS